jgi:ABC-type polysaccharide/polyol phosphate export permease
MIQEVTPRYDSARRPSPVWDEVVGVWRYRHLILQLVTRDIRVRYKRSILGVAWTMLNPLLMMLVLTLVFAHVFRTTVPHYPVYLLSGIVIWSFFHQSTTTAVHYLLSSRPLIMSMYVPRTAFAIAATGAGLVNLTLSLVPLVAIVLLTGAPLYPTLAWLPVPVALAAAFTLGVGLLVSILAVAFRDIVEMYQVVLGAWYFVTPVIYPLDIVPEDTRRWLLLNPMYYLVEAFRAPIFEGTVGEPTLLLVGALVAGGMLLVGWLVFVARSDAIVYSI